MPAPRLRRLVPVLLLLGAPLLATALQVEDWSRDLTTNRAATGPDSPDPRLRDLTLAVPPERLAAAIRAASDRLPGWWLAEERRAPGAWSWRLTRTTRVFGFVDDVELRARLAPGGELVLSGSSRSRVGRGDLGQNPRNLRLLWKEIADELAPR